MLTQVKENLRNLGVKQGDCLLVAVSGGPDSVCLLHLLSLLAEPFSFKLHVAHLNHSLRGKESDEDAEFVQGYSNFLKIPSTIVKKDIASVAKSMKRSKQDAARFVRYQVLEEISIIEKCCWIVTAHHADDQAETFLMRLIRGSGIRGLSSIPAKRGKIIRPILHLSREEILDYLQKNQISYREDSSNLLPLYFRNQIRQDLLPLLKRYNPNIVKVLGHEAEIFSEEEKFFEELVQREMPNVAELSTPDKHILKIVPFSRQALALQRGILRTLLFHLKGNLNHFHFSHIEQVIHLAINGATGKMIHLPEGILVYKLYDRLEFYVKKNPVPEEKLYFPLPLSGEVRFPALKMTFLIALKNAPLSEIPKQNEICFDFDQIIPPLIVRTRQAGDLIYPGRLRGKKKKLQDLFVDLKISRLLRDEIPLLAVPDRVLWVMGIERDFKSLISPETKTILSIETIPFS